MTDLLQPLDIAVMKPAKDYLKRRFEHWYSSEVTKQLQGISDIESAVIQPVNLSMAAIKKRSAKWLVDMAEYIADNPQFIVHGFLRAGITYALDGEEATESEGDSVDEPTEVISDDESIDGGQESEGDNGDQLTEVISDDEDTDDTNDMEKYYKDTSYNTQCVCLLLSPFMADVPFQALFKFVCFIRFC